jgi:hypothetical protein
MEEASAEGRTVETDVGDISHTVLDRPDRTVDDELELRRGEGDESREAELIDCTQELEEAESMLGELGKVLVDHAQRAFEGRIKDRRDLVGEKALQGRNRRGGSVERFFRL